MAADELDNKWIAAVAEERPCHVFQKWPTCAQVVVVVAVVVAVVVVVMVVVLVVLVECVRGVATHTPTW